MGWEVTCELCGKTEKHGIGCYCYYKEHLVNLERMRGANILDLFSLNDEFVSMLYKLQNGDRDVLSMDESAHRGTSITAIVGFMRSPRRISWRCQSMLRSKLRRLPRR